MWPLRGINKTAWGAKLILTADLAYPVNCVSLGHLLIEQHCRLCLNICFILPMAPHLPPPPAPTFLHLPTLMDLICDITAIKKKLPQKPGAFK